MSAIRSFEATLYQCECLASAYFEVGQGDARRSKEQELVCLCRKAWIEGDLVVGCDYCNEWFHLNCVQMSEQTAHIIESHKCNDCEQKAQPLCIAEDDPTRQCSGCKHFKPLDKFREKRKCCKQCVAVRRGEREKLLREADKQIKVSVNPHQEALLQRLTQCWLWSGKGRGNSTDGKERINESESLPA